ncbi:MAG: TlpA family protein disulfide reductase [Candidatus Brocadiales bacterium]|nr:TlpA family protein disulfide reductase [Candidatus Brocadiales bacterium]MBL7007194.1 TlpA family protein disulfide reductase [Spirochaetia bacterium]
MKRLIITFTMVTLLMLGTVSAVSIETLNEKFMAQGFSIPKTTLASIDFELKNIEGKMENLSDYKGKVVFLNFWATWCGPCRLEMPSMQKLYDEFKDDGLEIVAVNLGERQKTVVKYLEENKLTFPVLLDETNMVAGIYGARSIPTTYIIDREGNILSMTVGTREWYSEESRALFSEILSF